MAFAYDWGKQLHKKLRSKEEPVEQATTSKRSKRAAITSEENQQEEQLIAGLVEQIKDRKSAIEEPAKAKKHQEQSGTYGVKVNTVGGEESELDNLKDKVRRLEDNCVAKTSQLWKRLKKERDTALVSSRTTQPTKLKIKTKTVTRKIVEPNSLEVRKPTYVQETIPSLKAELEATKQLLLGREQQLRECIAEQRSQT